MKFNVLIVIYLFILLANTFAANSYAQPSGKKLTEAQSTCATSPIKCLEQIEPMMAQFEQPSRVYYALLLLKMDAIFALELDDRLYDEVKPWLTKQDLPLFFQLKTYIYYAKIVRARGEKTEAIAYINKAIELLSAANEKLVDPLIMIEIVNLRRHLDDGKEAAYQTLKGFEQKYAHIEEPVFRSELYWNLANLAGVMDNLDEQLHYRELCYQWTLQRDNIQQRGSATFNLARAYHQLKRHFEAANKYSEAIEWSKQAEDFVVVNIGAIYLAELYIEQQRLSKARSLLESVVLTELPHYRVEQYQRVLALLDNAQ